MASKTRGETSWNYSLVGATASRQRRRTGTPSRLQSGASLLHELTGFDGYVEGSLRPHPGFMWIADLNPHGETSPGAANDAWDVGLDGSYKDAGGAAQVVIDGRYAVGDFRPVQFDIGQASFAYGFVYRVTGGVNNKDHIFIQYRLDPEIDGLGTVNETQGWRRKELAFDIETDATWTVAVFGRLVYVFVRGRDPLLFYVNVTDEGGSPTYAEIIVDPIGPGAQPAFGDIRMQHLRDADGSDEDFGELTADVDTVRLSPIVNNLTGSTATNPNWESMRTYLQSIITGSGWFSAVGEQASFAKGAYSFAVQFQDSRTGRKSALTEVKTTVPTSGSHFLLVGGLYAFAFELVWDSTVWDQALMYRSISGQTAMLLDSVITLEDHETDLSGVTVSADPNMKRAVWLYTLSDAALAGQTQFEDEFTFDETPPKGGEAIVYKNALFVSDIELAPSEGGALTGVGETRWSSLFESSLELFPPSNRHIPDNPTDGVRRFLKVGGEIAGLSASVLTMFHREGTVVRPDEFHSGMTFVNARAADELSSFGWFVTTDGVKTIDAQGTLNDITALDQLLKEEWAGSLASVRLAADEIASAIYILNTVEERMAILWLGSAQMREFADASFIAVESGFWPLIPDDISSPLVKRAFFLLSQTEADTPGVGGAGTKGVFRIFLVDHARGKTNGPQTLDQRAGATVIQVANRSAGNKTVEAAGGGIAAGMKVEGGYAYVVNGGTVGAKAKILAQSATTLNLDSVDDIVDGDLLAISPVYCRAVTGPVMPQSEEGVRFTDEDFHRQRRIDSVSASFTSVTGVIGGKEAAAKFKGLVFIGDGGVAGEGVPVSQEGVFVQSVKNGSSVYDAAIEAVGLADDDIDGKYGLTDSAISFGIETWAAGLDFRLLAIRAMGAILESDRPEIPT